MKRAKCPNCGYANADKGVHELEYKYEGVSIKIYLRCIRCDSCKNLNLNKSETKFFNEAKDRLGEYVSSLRLDSGE